MHIKALYTGSFDPLTNGHLNIIERASKLYDELTIGIIVNYSKKSMFSLEERKEMIEETLSHLGNVKVEFFSGLLADYVNENKFNVVVAEVPEESLKFAHSKANFIFFKVVYKSIAHFVKFANNPFVNRFKLYFF